MAYQYGSYVQGNLFRGNYKKPGGQMYQPRTGWDKAANIGHDVGYYGALAYGLYQGKDVFGSAAAAAGRGIAGLARGALAMAPEAAEAAMILGAPLGI